MTKCVIAMKLLTAVFCRFSANAGIEVDAIHLANATMKSPIEGITEMSPLAFEFVARGAVLDVLYTCIRMPRRAALSARARRERCVLAVPVYKQRAHSESLS
jgi:hypothetical protein